MRLASVNVGRPRELLWQGRAVSTAIFKQAVAGPVAVQRFNLAGDRQADLTVHGGADKAVYAYATGHYPRWAEELGIADLPPGAFGENLTLDDFSEAGIRVGDRFRAGSAVFEVSQPRLPCYKLNLRHGRDDMVERMLANGMTGFYLRVLAEGTLQQGDGVERLASDDDAISIADAARLYVGASSDPALLRRAVASPALAEGWRERFRHRLAEIDS